MTLSDLERQDARGLIFRWDLHTHALSVCYSTTKFGMVIHLGTGFFLWWSSGMPLSEGEAAVLHCGTHTYAHTV